MDWLTFVARIAEALAWPIVVLVLGLMFRRKLLEIIPTLRKLKAGPVEAEFELAAKQALANAEETKIQGVDEASVFAVKTKADSGQVIAKLREARGDPAGAILEGWAKLDGELFRLGIQVGAVVNPLENTGKVYNAVMSSGVLPAQTMNLVRELRELRNQVAHVRVKPTAEAAQDYLLAVNRAVELILNCRKNLPDSTSSNR
ncbi:hypothetical protein [Stenotrophomonas sp. TWI602]|uniref:hypothetical protein n=1 Tax=Stenotrophomonas sp. TWI602 TaxID=3136786 RepID=UPI000FC23893